MHFRVFPWGREFGAVPLLKRPSASQVGQSLAYNFPIFKGVVHTPPGPAKVSTNDVSKILGGIFGGVAMPQAQLLVGSAGFPLENVVLFHRPRRRVLCFWDCLLHVSLVRLVVMLLGYVC